MTLYFDVYTESQEKQIFPMEFDVKENDLGRTIARTIEGGIGRLDMVDGEVSLIFIPPNQIRKIVIRGIDKELYEELKS